MTHDTVHSATDKISPPLASLFSCSQALRLVLAATRAPTQDHYLV